MDTNSVKDKSPRSKKEKKELEKKEKREKKERKERQRRESIASAGSVSSRSRSSSIVDGISDTAKKLANAIGGGGSANSSFGRNGGSKLARSSTTAAQLEQEDQQQQQHQQQQRDTEGAPEYVPYEPQQQQQQQSGSSSPSKLTVPESNYEPIPLKRESSLRKITATPVVRPSPSSVPYTIINDQHDYLAKVIVIGESGVGKTALRSRYCENKFDEDLRSTIGVEFSNVILSVRARKDSATTKNLKLQIWDTAGQEKFRAVTSAYYRGTTGALLVYDITKHDSFERIAGWIDQINEHCDRNKLPVVMVIGNKKDLGLTNRAVSKEEAEKWCSAKGYCFLETSAKTGENVRDAFQEFAELVYRQRIMTNQPMDDLGASLKKVPPSLKNTQRIAASASTEDSNSSASIVMNETQPNTLRVRGQSSSTTTIATVNNSASSTKKCAC